MMLTLPLELFVVVGSNVFVFCHDSRTRRQIKNKRENDLRKRDRMRLTQSGNHGM